MTIAPEMTWDLNTNAQKQFADPIDGILNGDRDYCDMEIADLEG